MIHRILERPLMVYVLLGLVILGPMLLPGYIFALDMVFGTHVQLPHEVTASYPFYAALKLLNIIMPSWLIQKIMLLAIITCSGLGAHRLMQNVIGNQYTDRLGPYFAGLLYVVNPFTYTRFMDGHFAVLLGYAVLPFFVQALYELLFGNKLNILQACKTALLACICVVFSVHAIGYLAVLSLVATSVFVAQSRRSPKVLLAGARYLGAVIMLFVLFNSYWIVPTLTGSTPRASLIQGFDMRHFLSFRTDGASDLGVVGNALSLHGYWGDKEGRYILTQQANPLWPVIYMFIFTLAIYGAYRMRQSAMTWVLTISALLALIVAIGVAAAPFNHLNTWLIQVVPFFRGFREPQKFLSILALFYAVMGGAGIAYLLRSRPLAKTRSRGNTWLFAIVLIVPFIYTPTMVGGFAGQLHARTYPTDWASTNEAYISKSTGKTLFLPWHQYMYFDFAGRVIANPAPTYFGSSVFAGDNVEIGLIHRQTDNPDSKLIEEALMKKDPITFNQMLQNLQVEYVVLSKNADWQQYNYLSDMQLERVADTETLQIYRNTSFR